MEEYEQQAKEFLKKTDTKLEVSFLKHGKHFYNDTETRDIYIFKFTRGDRIFKGKFGQSLNDSYFRIINKNTGKEVKYMWHSEAEKFANRDEKKFKQFVLGKIHSLGCYKIEGGHIKPTAYDILSCITKNDPETFKDFCDNFGYDNDSISAHKIYDEVLKEWSNVQRIWTDSEIEQLQEVE